MADLAGFLKALAATTAIHPYGHVQYGNEHGLPTSIEWQKGIENVGPPSDVPVIDKDNMSASFPGIIDPTSAQTKMGWNGAGFKIQDDVARATTGTPEQENAYLANAASKGAYALGIPDAIFGKNMVPGGDIGQMQRISGNKWARPMMGFSALMDLIKSQRPQQQWDVSAGPIGNSSAMGLTFNTRF